MKLKKWLPGILVLVTIAAFGQNNTLNDQDIADAIENEYMFDHAIDVNKVDVTVLNGVAEVTGTVNNLQAKERATNIAELVKGVRTISNRIEVQPPVVLSDYGIKQNVEMALLNDPATDSYEVDVSVHDKVVTLSGTVDSYQEKVLTEKVAKSVKGVTGMVNNITIDHAINRPDREIEAEVIQALKWNVLVDDGLIDVDVNKGEVTLSGIVGSAAERTNAYLTSWVSGVTNVVDSDLKVEWWAEDEELRNSLFATATDKEIENAIHDAAVYDPRLLFSEITAESENGWVTLRGTVSNLKAKVAAEKLAEHTMGVTGVTNRIKVRLDLPPTDEEIASDVRSALANNSVTEAWEIDVDVNFGIVTLSGVVDSYLEKKEAEWMANGVEGVTEVNNILTVNYPYSYYWYGYYPYYSLYITPPEETGLVPDDALIKTRVANELWWSPYVDRDEIEITVNDGEVILQGTVDSWREYRKAAENAWEGGAWTVDNQLRVE